MLRREADLAVDLDALGLGLHALELDAVVELHDVDAVEESEEVEVPPRAAELAVGGQLQPGILFAHDEVGDRRILDPGEGVGVDRPFGVLGTGALEGLGTQETADDVGAVRGNDAHRSIVSPVPVNRRVGVIVGHQPVSEGGVRVVRCLPP